MEVYAMKDVNEDHHNELCFGGLYRLGGLIRKGDLA